MEYWFLLGSAISLIRSSYFFAAVRQSSGLEVFWRFCCKSITFSFFLSMYDLRLKWLDLTFISDENSKHGSQANASWTCRGLYVILHGIYNEHGAFMWSYLIIRLETFVLYIIKVLITSWSTLTSVIDHNRNFRAMIKPRWKRNPLFDDNSYAFLFWPDHLGQNRAVFLTYHESQVNKL